MQRQTRIVTTHQPVPLDARKSRVRPHQPGVLGAIGALQPLEIFCIAGGPRWDAGYLSTRGGFRHSPKLSPALEILSSPVVLRNNLESQTQKPKSQRADNPTRHTP